MDVEVWGVPLLELVCRETEGAPKEMLRVRPYFNIYPHKPRKDGGNLSRCREKGTSEPKWMGWDRAICFHSAVLRTLITVYLGPVARHLCI